MNFSEKFTLTLEGKKNDEGKKGRVDITVIM